MTQAETIPDLAPCPFCGGKAFRDSTWAFCCGTLNCQASTMAFNTEAEAVAAWNRRALPADPSRAVLEEAEKALTEIATGGAAGPIVYVRLARAALKSIREARNAR